MLHVVSNMTKDLQGQLAYWPTWLDGLRHVCRLLRRRHCRTRFLEQCFRGTGLDAMKTAFDSFDGDVYESRWGSIFHALGALLPLQRVLRAAWSKERYMDGGGVEQRSAEGVSVDSADSAIRSGLFWAYSSMIRLIGDACDELAWWSESCPCHCHDSDLRAPTRHERGLKMAAKYGFRSCPLRSCQAAACAAGEPREILRRIFETGVATVALLPEMAELTVQDRSLVMADFLAAKQHLDFYLTAKLSHWGQLPWILFGLSHWDAMAARACCSRALALWASQPHAAGSTHWLSFALCAPGTQGHAEMVRFISGDSLDSVPFLRHMAGVLAFAPVSERWVEGLHARSHKSFRAAPHASPVHMAFHSVLRELTDRLQQNPQQLEHFAAMCMKVRSAPLAIEEVGLRHHPGIARLANLGRQGGFHARCFHKRCVEILYHVDGLSLHAPWPQGAAPPGQSPPPTRPGGPGRRLPPYLAIAGGLDGDPDGDLPRPGVLVDLPRVAEASVAPAAAADPSAADMPGGVHDDLWRAAAVEHLEKLIADAAEAGRPAPVFSLGPHLQSSEASFLALLEDICNPPPTAAEIQAGPAFTFHQPDPEAGDAVEEVAAPHEVSEQPSSVPPGLQFFMVVETRAAWMHLPRSAPRPRRGQLCVRPLRVAEVDAGQRRVRVFLEGRSGTTLKTGVLSISLLSVPDLCTMRLWAPEAALRYGFGQPVPLSLEGASAELFPQLCARSADGFQCTVIFDSADMDFSKRGLLQWMESRGLATEVQQDAATSSWQLTEVGASSLELRFELVLAGRALDPREGVAIADKTSLELAVALEQGVDTLCAVVSVAGWRPAETRQRATQ